MIQLCVFFFQSIHSIFKFNSIFFCLCQGVPKDSTTEETIKICLGELDRCYEDNVVPYFLNLNW